MEWVDGARLNDKAAIDAMGLDSSKFVDTLVQCSLRQMLENGFFHADPHAGNLLAMPSGNAKSLNCLDLTHLLLVTCSRAELKSHAGRVNRLLTSQAPSPH
jgi:predicted unusual protein kinase regulating ubiquinone biosynthesis (AarF/ABC1/UbiB family)